MSEPERIENDGMNVVADIIVTTDDLKEYYFKAKLKKLTKDGLKCRFEELQQNNYVEFYIDRINDIMDIRLERGGSVMQGKRARLIEARLERDGNFEDICLFFTFSEDMKLYEYITELNFSAFR